MVFFFSESFIRGVNVFLYLGILLKGYSSKIKYNWYVVDLCVNPNKT